MTIFTFANNVNTTLAGGISSSSTSLTLASTANLPSSIPAGEVLAITLNDVATRQNFEIIYATSISGATLSGLMRGQEGTSAHSWATGDYAYSPPTAGQMQSFGQLSKANTWGAANTFNDPVSVAAAVASGHAVNLGQFLASVAGNGFVEIPTPIGVILIQWGQVQCSASGITTSLFTTPWPNGASMMVASPMSPTAAGKAGAAVISKSQFNIASTNIGGTVFYPDSVGWIAVGN